MRIAADGTWFYNGTPIGRPALVKLFASVLRKDPDRFVLVTPVERVGIVVEDAPFQAVEMAVEGEGDGRRIAFRTNVDDLVSVGRTIPCASSAIGRRREALCPRARGLVGPRRPARSPTTSSISARSGTLDGPAVFGLSACGLISSRSRRPPRRRAP